MSYWIIEVEQVFGTRSHNTEAKLVQGSKLKAEQEYAKTFDVCAHRAAMNGGVYITTLIAVDAVGGVLMKETTGGGNCDNCGG